MPAFTYGDYVYLNENYEVPKINHKKLIKKQEPHTTITPPMILLEEKLKTLAETFVKVILVPRIEQNI